MDAKIVITIALVVFASSIIVFFAHEFGNFFKKIYSIPGLKLFIPLILASWFIEMYSDWGLWLFLWFQAMLNRAINSIATIFPIENSPIFIKIIFLSLISCFPLWFYTIKAKYKKLRTPMPNINYWISLVLWLIGALLLIFG